MSKAIHYSSSSVFVQCSEVKLLNLQHVSILNSKLPTKHLAMLKCLARLPLCWDGSVVCTWMALCESWMASLWYKSPTNPNNKYHWKPVSRFVERDYWCPKTPYSRPHCPHSGPTVPAHPYQGPTVPANPYLSQDYDIEDWQQQTIYRNYRRSDRQIQW